ncbi:hypothetical protein Tco_0105415 [Tanacetum coccineum]
MALSFAQDIQLKYLNLSNTKVIDSSTQHVPRYRNRLKSDSTIRVNHLLVNRLRHGSPRLPCHFAPKGLWQFVNASSHRLLLDFIAPKMNPLGSEYGWRSSTLADEQHLRVNISKETLNAIRSSTHRFSTFPSQEESAIYKVLDPYMNRRIPCLYREGSLVGLSEYISIGKSSADLLSFHVGSNWVELGSFPRVCVGLLVLGPVFFWTPGLFQRRVLVISTAPSSSRSPTRLLEFSHTSFELQRPLLLHLFRQILVSGASNRGKRISIFIASLSRFAPGNICSFNDISLSSSSDDEIQESSLHILLHVCFHHHGPSFPWGQVGGFYLGIASVSLSLVLPLSLDELFAEAIANTLLDSELRMSSIGFNAYWQKAPYN